VDGNLWFTENQVGAVGRITTSGVITEFALPGYYLSHVPYGIALGPDSNIWFSDGLKLSRITPSGGITEFNVLGGFVAQMTIGPGGNLWFTEASTNFIGRATIPAPATVPVVSKWGFAVLCVLLMALAASAGVSSGPVSE
jgi:virginiamycin B lyase